MSEQTSANHNNEEKEDWSKNYCFGCLCADKEKNLQAYAFQCPPLKDIFQMDTIFLCYLCKRMAQHTEMFIQNVQSNKILLDNFYNMCEETLKSVGSQTQPLVNLSQVPLHVLEFLEKDSHSCEESFSVITKNVDVKVEMKEEEYLEHLEAEFINGSDEFSEPFIKNEDDSFPLKALLKEELELEDIDSLDLLSLSTATKKKKVKNKSKIKTEDGMKDVNKIDKYKVKQMYITREQCIEERKKLMQDKKYLDCLYKCTDCIKGFSFKGSYDRHMEKHNQLNGDYECDICKQRMDSEDKLVGHMRYHLNRFKCGECGLIRNCRRTIQDHYSVYHCQDFCYSCPHCNKTFKRGAYLRKHVRYAHTRACGRVTCAYCHRTYANKQVLRSHIVLKHSKEAAVGEIRKKYACQECGMAFRAPSQLKNHSIKHSDSRQYYCVECDKSFKSDASLKNHLKTTATHINYIELPLQCVQCDKRFAIRRDLDRHMNRVHLNVKPYSCDKCEKAYVSSWQLKDHQRLIHEGYKRPMQYPCPMCDKVFTRNQILKSHIRTHTGERPFQCSKCPAQFSQASILRTHDRLIHLKLTRDGRPKVK